MLQHLLKLFLRGVFAVRNLAIPMVGIFTALAQFPERWMGFD
jgi:hypothetical protein